VRQAQAAGGARAGNAEIVLDEMDAARMALDRSRPGDLVVLCVDYATEVFKEIESRRGSASPQVMLASEGNGHAEAVGGDPDLLGV
jgi:cyanophycin synthetase